MEWIKTSRLDAVIVHQKNGSLHLRSRSAHCIWNIKIREEIISPLEGKIKTLMRTVGNKKNSHCIWGFINGILNSKEEVFESPNLSLITEGEEVFIVTK